MSRISLATDVRTRTGVPDKDARMKNSYIELRGEQSAARKRPSSQGGVPTGTGIAQGGYGLIVVYGDTLYSISNGTTWNSATAYSVGDHVAVGYVDYWALTDNTNKNPTSNPTDWSRSYVPAIPPISGWTLGTMAFTPTFGNHSIAYNGTIFCYLQEDPISGFCYPFTSTDGLTWTQQAEIVGLSSVGFGQFGIIWNGIQFLVFGFATDGTSYWAISPNGIAWTIYSDVIIDNFQDVTWNGSIYCSVALNLTTLVYTSTNGISWTARTVPASPNGYHAITWNGSVFCIVGFNSNIAATSPDGIVWTTRTLPYSTSWRFVTSKGSLICATGGNGTRIAVSTDNGATWSGIIPATQVQAIAATGSLIVGVNPGAVTSTYSTSTDGLTWTNRTLPATKVWGVITYGSGKGFVVMDTTTVCAFSITGT